MSAAAAQKVLSELLADSKSNVLTRALSEKDSKGEVGAFIRTVSPPSRPRQEGGRRRGSPRARGGAKKSYPSDYE